MFKRILDARIRDLWQFYEATGELNHPGEKGLLREMFVRRVLESLLPTHLGVGSGTVVDKWNQQSGQVDLLVYDKRRIPPLLEENGHGIYPMDAVLRVLEVKSTLRKRDLEQLRGLAWSFNPDNDNGLKMAMTGNLEGGQINYPLVGLFAYSTDVRDIMASVESVGGMTSDSVMLCVAESGVYLSGGSRELPLPDVASTTRTFMAFFLQAVESDAASRKNYSLIEWLLS